MSAWTLCRSVCAWADRNTLQDNVWAQVTEKDGETKTQKKQLDVQLKKGCPNRTRIRFEKAGTQKTGWINGTGAVGLAIG